MTKEELDAIRERCKKVSYTAVAQDRASAESYIYQNIKDIYMLLSGVDAAIKRAEALERALRQAVNGDCSACKFKDDENAVCCSDGIDRWDFDQARFERKEAGEP